MPICKNCHRTISKFDKDICPFCGTENPIEDNYQTKDVTLFIKATSTDDKLYKSKSKKATGFLCALLGSFGAHNFYLGFTKKAVIELLITLALVGGVGALLFLFVDPLKNALAFVLPFAFCFVFYLFASVRYFKNDSLADANGVFLR